MNKVIILGSHCNYDITIGNLLLGYSIPFVIYRQNIDFDSQKINNGFLSADNYLCGNRSHLLKCIKSGDVIIDCTNSFFSVLGAARSLYCLFIKKVKIVSLPTGSDITEFILSKSWGAYFYRFYRKLSVINIIPPYPHAISNSMILKTKNIYILRYPYLLNNNKTEGYKLSKQQDIIYLHASNIDFGKNDSHGLRNSTKGNDKFFNALIKAFKNGYNFKCFVLDRGPDKELIKKLIIDANATNNFIFLPEQSPEELCDLFSRVDCIVDQFDVGGFGMISMEAMSQAKPVMIFIDQNCWPLVYAEEPPVINCHTEDEIYNAIIEWSDRKKLQDLGERAEKWVRKYHDVHTADFSEFILRVCQAADLEWPRKDLAKIHE